PGSVTLAAIAGLAGMRRFTRVRFTAVAWPEIREIYKEGFPVFLSTAAITLYTRSNLFILGFLANERELGYFGVAQRIVEAAKSLVMPISTALFPHISHLSASRPMDAIGFLRRNVVRLTAPFAALSAALLVLA